MATSNQPNECESMSELKYCQGPKCHMYDTKDRKRGPKDNKRNETRRRSHMYYGKGNFCSLTCYNDWAEVFSDRAIDHFGRIHEPKRQDASGAWYKTYDWRGNGNDRHYFANDLLGERRPITQQQYQDENLTTPPS